MITRNFDNWSATLDARDAQIDKLAQLGVDDWRRALELSDSSPTKRQDAATHQ